MISSYIKKFIILLIVLLGIICSKAAAQPIKFDHITLEEGLLHGTVFTILQDRSGFIWLGTANGLQRYDGYQFINYQLNNDNEHSVSDNNITSLFEDNKGQLWVGTRNGLNLFDANHQNFTRYLNNSDNQPLGRIYQVCADRQGRIWVMANNTLYRMDATTNRLIKINNLPFQADQDNKRKLLLADHQGGIWLALTQGLCEYRESSDTFIHQPISNQREFEFNYANAIYEDKQGRIWIGGNNNIYSFDRERKEYNFYPLKLAPSLPQANDIHCDAFTEDQDGGLWLATNYGLAKFNWHNNRWQWYLHDANDTQSLSFNLLASLYCDQSGTIWVGTGANGINKFNPTQCKFLHYYHIANDNNSISDSFVASFYEDKEGVLWIGTFEGGLNRFDRTTEKFISYQHDVKRADSLPSNEVRDIIEDHQGVMWIANGAGGLLRFDRNNNSFHTFPLANTQDNITPNVRILYEDAQQNLWIGTNNGLFRLDQARKEVTLYLHDVRKVDTISDNGIMSIYQDHTGTLWIGTRNGLNRFDITTGKFNHYQHIQNNPNSISSNAIYAILEVADGLWIGTDNYLNKWHKDSDSFTTIDAKNGLPNNVIYGILADEHGHLWLSTNHGLCQYDPINNRARAYTLNDGLQNYEYNAGAYFKTNKGEMLFGGIGGFNIFSPANIKDSTFQPPIYITGIKVLDKPSAIQPNITLSYRNNIIEFNFVSLDYTHSENNQYAYKLEGIDNHWIQAGTTRSVRYPYLPPGQYTFRVKGSNSDRVWADKTAEILLIIQPPFWQTLWFRIAMIVTIFSILAGAYKWRILRIEMQKEALEKLIAQRTTELREKRDELENNTIVMQKQRDSLQQANLSLNHALQATEEEKHKAISANRSKSTFLANMSHELRTPLNAILGFVQLMERDTNRGPADREKLSVIMNSGEHLLGLINDVLSISKIEAGQIILNRQSFNLHKFLTSLREMFENRAQAKNIRFTVDYNPRIPKYVVGDESRLRQVLINLLGNAIKFTDHGSVYLKLIYKSERAYFEVIDTGQGIDANEMDKLFTPFVQTDSGLKAKEGAGLGLVISQNLINLMGDEIKVKSQFGQGSTFSFNISLPIGAISKERVPTRKVVHLAAQQPEFRILAADDAEEGRRFLVELLSTVGFNVRQASNGQETIKIWEQWQPHLIWMDMRMPVINGKEATEFIRAKEQEQQQLKDHNKTIIIALTASAFEYERGEILGHGCNDFVLKPYKVDKIFDILTKYLNAQFIYEENITETSSLDNIFVDKLQNNNLPKIDLASLPAELLEKLSESITTGAVDEANRVIESINQYDQKIAQQLSSMLKKYQLQEIFSLIEENRAKQKTIN